MTHPPTVEQLHEDETVQERYGDAMAVPLFAAIQQTFEEAMASIDDLACRSWLVAPERADRLPRTEKIDLRLVKPPVPDAPTPPTTAMSLAARFLAEHPITGDAGRPAAVPAPGPERRRAAAPTLADARAMDLRADPPPAPRRRLRWWWS